MNALPARKVGAVRRALLAGNSIRSTAKIAGVHCATVRRIQRAMVAGEGLIPLCKCGKSASHRGWCASRFKQSKTRQAVMAELQKTRKRKSHAVEVRSE